MSRIIVKNLPNALTEQKLREQFSQKGTITDVQLKYTNSGKFRHFAFIGFENEEQAQCAINYFNKTYINSSRITVEQCAELGDENKPRAWSKYSTESSAFKKLHPEEEKTKIKEDQKQKVENKAKESVDPELKELIDKHKDDPTFLEFLNVHGQNKKIWDNDDGISQVISADKGTTKNQENEDSVLDDSTTKEIAADSKISDLDYLKMKSKENLSKGVLNAEKYHTVVLRGLPYKIKKRDVKEFFKPLKIDSIRIPPKIKGLAYVGFKAEKSAHKALIKNKSFINGKQIFVYPLKMDSNKNHVKNEIDNVSHKTKWKNQEQSLEMEESIAESGRIFVRNLPYTITEDKLQSIFEKHGPVTEVVVPIDKLTRVIKGFAVITFLMPEHAVKAYSELDGRIFHGRMLHLLPGKAKETELFAGEKDGTSYKKKKSSKLKAESGSSHNWNTLFLGQNAIADVIAENYGISKEEVLSGDNAAVRLALAETQMVNDTKQFLEDSGVKLDAFNQAVNHRSKNVILVKNLPANTDANEIRELFSKFGILGRVLLPRSGVTAIVEYLEPVEARAAFRKLAYSKFKNLPLYLEWAPENTFVAPYKVEDNTAESKTENQPNNETIKQDEDENNEEPEPDSTLYIKNLNFNTTEDNIREHFKNCGKIASITVARKKDLAHPGTMLSMGYGFIQFYRTSCLNNALKTLQQSSLDGHTIELKRSNRTLTTEVTANRKTTNMQEQTGSKILVRNIPFQAKESEIRELFSTFGEIKSVRLPKKLVGTGSHRGFCFVDYCTKFDAKRAMTSLCQSTHLFGRRLVLEWAQNDDNDLNQLRKRTAQHFVSDTRNMKKSMSDIKVTEDDEDV